jgi:hypothetical protein
MDPIQINLIQFSHPSSFFIAQCRNCLNFVAEEVREPNKYYYFNQIENELKPFVIIF